MGTDPHCNITPSPVDSDHLTLESDGLHLAGQVYRPASLERCPAIVCCHGFGSSKESHAEFSRSAAQAGFVVLALDFRGHGQSEGCLDSRTLNDVGCALAWLESEPQVDPARIAIRGSSMGGYFALHAAAR